ncbi:hypothetical protein [Psychrobacter ciconiae]|uniref:hypothetical protein n=1 Tax=Psychrobacter ciconiae TaxID=1553449 RepID=UPI001918B8CB|nr:hypothetical protein [Psychrobacter ciconiae]
MGIWIAIAVALFVLGSMLALKPNGIDQRLDALRMSARRLGLNPKLIACPDWIRGRDEELGRGMMGQYGLVLDNIQLPSLRYQVIDGHFRVLDSDDKSQKTAFLLDNVPVDLPPTIAPFAKALYIKANSIVIFWEDVNYVRPKTNPNYQKAQIEPDLLALKSRLEALATQLQQSLK